MKYRKKDPPSVGPSIVSACSASRNINITIYCIVIPHPHLDCIIAYQTRSVRNWGCWCLWYGENERMNTAKWWNRADWLAFMCLYRIPKRWREVMITMGDEWRWRRWRIEHVNTSRPRVDWVSFERYYELSMILIPAVKNEPVVNLTNEVTFPVDPQNRCVATKYWKIVRFCRF